MLYDFHSFVKGNKTIVRNGNDIEFELNDYPNYKGTLRYKSHITNQDFEGEQYDFIDGNGFVVFTEDVIILRLKKNPTSYWCFYYLDNWKGGNTKESVKANFQKKRSETIKTKTEKLHQLYRKLYDEKTTKAIFEKKVTIGMMEEGIEVILGKANKINITETVDGISKQYVYDNMYIYSDKGKVTAIQREE